MDETTQIRLALTAALVQTKALTIFTAAQLAQIKKTVDALMPIVGTSVPAPPPATPKLELSGALTVAGLSGGATGGELPAGDGMTVIYDPTP